MAKSVQSSEATTSPCLAADSIRRICIHLILAEQAELVARGMLPKAAMAALQRPDLTAATADALRIDEEGLGFDSLARLGLILRVNRFFNLTDTGVEDYLLMQRSLGEWVGLIGQHFHLVGPKARLTFATSGSSGPVKQITHGLSDLADEVVAHLDGPFAGAAPKRILAMVPPHHIYGFLFTALLPAHLGLPVLDLTHLGPTAALRLAQAGDLIVGTPFNWQTLADCGLRFASGVAGVTSAGPSTPTTWAMPDLAGLAGMTEIYGATETGGIGSRKAAEASFTLLPHLVRNDASVRRLTGAEMDLQDRLDWVDARSFYVLGRRDDVVQVAGVNVSPVQVAAVIRGLEGVAEVIVRLGPQRLRAFVVPSDPLTEAWERALHAEIARVLPAPARPAPISFGPALPRNAMGKLCDWSDAGGAG